MNSLPQHIVDYWSKFNEFEQNFLISIQTMRVCNKPLTQRQQDFEQVLLHKAVLWQQLDASQ